MMGRLQVRRKRKDENISRKSSNAPRINRQAMAEKRRAQTKGILGMRVPIAMPGRIVFHETVKSDWKSEKGSGWQAACYSMRIYRSALESFSCRIEVAMPVKAFDVKEKMYRYINRASAARITNKATFKVGLELAGAKKAPRTHAVLCILLRKRMLETLQAEVGGAKVNAGPHTLNKKQCTS